MVESESESCSPFSPTLLLPVQSILDKAVEKLVKWHFVRSVQVFISLRTANLKVSTAVILSSLGYGTKFVTSSIKILICAEPI